MKVATFDFGPDNTRLSGEVKKTNRKTVLVKAQLPEDFGDEVVFIKRHIIKHNVEIEDVEPQS